MGPPLPAWVVDCILVGVAAEGLVLLKLRAAAGMLWWLAAGAALLLALRSALVGAAWWVTAGCLLAALLAHLAELRARLSRRRAAPP